MVTFFIIPIMHENYRIILRIEFSRIFPNISSVQGE